MYSELSEAKIAWLSQKISDLFGYHIYPPSKTYDALYKLKEDGNVRKYKYLAALVYQKDKDGLESELQILCQE